ncbi:hypothetical protein [Pseudodesulfovibrio senegalensis]|uniref:VCBS repeat-containing protein n=1 Tax=Pseudodesulfovibrio senegalensis TaxID=1721087 RepID=A0A6N6N0W9_9BACT|nr:hypothetical protein [Pseudodesulfovibrio senegalensis]KAB1441373.1 hypothetical protein F8A88_10525 [Pseudodesulfovibrio senegalensis]
MYRSIAVSFLCIGCCLFWSAPNDCWSKEKSQQRVVVNEFIPFDAAANGKTYALNKAQVEGYPATLDLFYDQVGLVLVVEFEDGVRVRLPYHFDIGYDFDGEVHWERRTNQYAIKQYDLTGDGIDEILFAVVVADGESMSQVEVNVLRYHPPLMEEDLSRPENWELASSLKADGVMSPVEIVLDGASVRIPKTRRGFYHELSWCQGKFHDTGEF